MTPHPLTACHDCDLLQRLPPPPPGGAAQCPRCGAVLHRHKRDSLDRTLALGLAGLVLFVVANGFPFLAFEMQGQATQTRLITGVLDLYAQGMWGLAALVLFTTILAPALELTLLLYVLLPLKLGRTPWKLPQVFRLLQRITPWGMMEVFLLGILVSVVKLAGMATVVPGPALWSFGALIIVLAAASAALDPHQVWNKMRVQAS